MVNRESDPWDDSTDVTWGGCFSLVVVVALVILLAFLAAYLRS
jgi:hypothetical protein